MNNLQIAPTPGRVIKKGKLIYSQILINSSPGKVWKVITDFEDYPQWNPFIKSIHGLPIPGEHISAFLQPPGNKGMTFEPKVLVYEPFREFRWIGKLLVSHLFDGEHAFILKDNKDGTTTFIQYERFRGLLLPFLTKMLDQNTLAGFNSMNAALKQRCEA
jgi:hypothetical protein